MSGILFQALLVLAVAITGSLAVCDFHYSLSTDDDSSLLRIGNSFAVIRRDSARGTWTGYIKQANNLTITDYTWRSESHIFENLSKEAKRKMKQVLAKPVTGIKLTASNTLDTKMKIDTNGNSVNIKRIKSIDAYKLINENNLAIVYMNGESFDLDVVFYHSDGPVVVVDNLCAMTIEPMFKLDREVQGALKSAMDK